MNIEGEIDINARPDAMRLLGTIADMLIEVADALNVDVSGLGRPLDFIVEAKKALGQLGRKEL